MIAKKMVALLLVGLMAVGLFACGNSSETSEPSESESAAGNLHESINDSIGYHAN